LVTAQGVRADNRELFAKLRAAPVTKAIALSEFTVFQLLFCPTHLLFDPLSFDLPD
jgi:hypothetical protein